MALTEMKLKLEVCSVLTLLFDVCETNYMHSPIVSKHVKMLRDDFDKLDEMDVDDIDKVINHADSLCKHVSKLEGDMDYRYWNAGLHAQLAHIDVKIFSVKLDANRLNFKHEHDQRMDDIKNLRVNVKKVNDEFIISSNLKEEPQ